MKAIRRLLKRLISSATRKLELGRLQAEIEEHLAMQTAENMRAGLNPTEARRRAVLKFGAVEAVKEAYRLESGLPLAEAVLQDARYAIRRLRKAPAFTLTTVLTVALGTGVTTSIFTLVYAVMLKSLAVAKPAELLRLGKSAQCCYYGGYSQDPEFAIVSHELYKYFRDHTQGFSELAAFSAGTTGFGVRRSGSPESAFSDIGELISGNYFKMFELRAFSGRMIIPADDQPKALPVAVMSYRLWNERYRSDPSLVGNAFYINGKPFTIVGIAPPGFYGDSLRATPPDFFVPLATGDPGPDNASSDPKLSWLQLIGRMRPGSKAELIEAEMRLELKQWLRSHWGDMNANEHTLFSKQTLNLAPGGAGITGMRDEYEHWLHVLMMVSGFVLLIVCANVANLMLVRGLERRRQTAVSIALGARPAALMRQAFVESVLLSVLGGGLGLAIAFGATSFALRFVFPRVGEMAGVTIDASPSMAILLFAFALSLLTGITFGIAPGWMATRVDPIEALRGANTSTARSGSLPRRILLVLQAAVALVLVSAAGLLTSALHKLEHQDFGFEQNRRVIVSFDPRLAGYEPAKLDVLYRSIEDAVRRIPGVANMALCIYSPLSGNNWGNAVWIQGHRPPGPNEDAEASYDRVTPGYFVLIGTPILRGRGIAERDTAASEHVAVINQAFAGKFFKNEDPIGKYFGWAGDRPTRYKVVGIAKDARYLIFNLDQPIQPFLFLPEAQHDFVAGTKKERDPGSHYLQNMVIVTAPGSTMSYARLRGALASVDPNLPVTSIHTLQEQVETVFRPAQLIARLTSGFGLLSLVLCSIGLYGVAAYGAAQRRKEIGVRIALGANRRHAIGLVVGGPFALILAGLFVGVPLTWAASRILAGQISGLNPYDAATTGFAIVALASCGLAASLIPAVRASLIPPFDALRLE